MENPWLALTEQSWAIRDGILDIDRDAIDAFNARIRKEALRIQVRSLPEPFIGNPATARVVLLGLNPAHSAQDTIDYEMTAFRAALFKNLHHQPQAYPFYPVNPQFQRTGTGAWWRAHTARLRADSGLQEAIFAERVLAIEWFPYHSAKGPHLKGPVICPSQQYSFYLAQEMRKAGKILIMLRSGALWTITDKGLSDVPKLKNRQRVWLTPGNMPAGLYQRILEKLRETT